MALRGFNLAVTSNELIVSLNTELKTMNFKLLQRQDYWLINMADVIYKGQFGYNWAI